MFKVLGIALVALAIGLAVVPNFTDCESQGKLITLASGKTTSMKCHWAGRAEVAVALPLAVVGAAMVVSRRKQSLMTLSIVGIALGATAISLPAFVIGTCATPTMTCNTVMEPLVTAMGGVAAAGSLAGMVRSFKLVP